MKKQRRKVKEGQSRDAFSMDVTEVKPALGGRDKERIKKNLVFSE